METFMTTWRRSSLALFLGSLPIVAIAYAAGCNSSSPPANSPSDASATDSPSATSPDSSSTSCTGPAVVCSSGDASSLVDVVIPNCLLDQCSVATLQAIITAETAAATAGAKATDPNVAALANQIASDFAADQTNLTALETSQVIMSQPCSETTTVGATLQTDLAPISSATGAALNGAFVQSEITAL